MALTQFQNTEEIAADLERLASELERLRLAFDQYFLGLEKREPVKLRNSVKELIRKYSGMAIQNSRLKFRYQQTTARYKSFTNYWDRILREIEEGRYTRDVFKAKIHEKERSQPQFKKKAQKPTSTDPVTQLFEKYVASRTQTKEATQGLSLDRFRQSLKGQVEAIKKKTGASSVRFQIKIEDGKTKLKALPQKK